MIAQGIFGQFWNAIVLDSALLILTVNGETVIFIDCINFILECSYVQKLFRWL